MMQLNRFNMGTKGAIESVHINGMSVVLSSLNLESAFFPPGQSEVSVIIRFLVLSGVHKTRFECQWEAGLFICVIKL